MADTTCVFDLTHQVYQQVVGENHFVQDCEGSALEVWSKTHYKACTRSLFTPCRLSKDQTF